MFSIFCEYGTKTYTIIAADKEDDLDDSIEDLTRIDQRVGLMDSMAVVANHAGEQGWINWSVKVSADQAALAR